MGIASLKNIKPYFLKMIDRHHPDNGFIFDNNQFDSLGLRFIGHIGSKRFSLMEFLAIQL